MFATHCMRRLSVAQPGTAPGSWAGLVCSSIVAFPISPPNNSGTALSDRVIHASMASWCAARGFFSRYVGLVLERSGRNKRKACRALGISYHTLQAYLRYAHRLQVASAQERSPEYSVES